MKLKIIYLLFLLCLLFKNSNLSAQNQNVSILAIENSDNSIDLSYEKKNPGSYTLTLEFSNVKNCNVKTYQKIISESSGFIMKLEPLSKEENITYSMQYYAALGAINTTIDNQFRYILPFKNGKKYKYLKQIMQVKNILIWKRLLIGNLMQYLQINPILSVV